MEKASQNPSAEQLERLLGKIDQSPAGLKALAGEEKPWQQEWQRLSRALAEGSPAGEDHCDLETISQMADARRAQGESWELPPHLAQCPTCLELFQVVLEGVPQPSRRFLRRLRKIPGEVDREPQVVWWASRWMMSAKIAAAIALLLGGLWLAQPVWRARALRVSEGQVALSNGKTLTRGGGIPEGVVIQVREFARAGFRDGSQLDLAPGSHFSFHKSGNGSTTVRLIDGAVTAAVARQVAGQEFIVLTHLGEVVVVGTRFKVTCSGGDSTGLGSGNGSIPNHDRTVRVVHIKVMEGHVRVRNQHEEIALEPNQVAVLRENQPHIELLADLK